jgi:hypothetical protein
MCAKKKTKKIKDLLIAFKSEMSTTESAALPNAKPAEGSTPTVILCIGMAGSGKTTFMQVCYIFLSVICLDKVQFDWHVGLLFGELCDEMSPKLTNHTSLTLNTMLITLPLHIEISSTGPY